MADIDRGGPAFPHHEGKEEGMTLRQFYAGHAVAGLAHLHFEHGPRAVAEWALEIADALIEREAGGK